MVNFSNRILEQQDKVYVNINRYKCRIIHALKQWFKGRGYGAKSKLSNQQKDQLYKMIKAGPEKNGFDSGIWNSEMIMELILMKFRIKYNLSYLNKLLKKIGLHYQKAKFISDEVDKVKYQKAREKWVEEIWPQILKEAKKNNAIILFGDETSFSIWSSLTKTWAPIEKQPVVRIKECRKGFKIFGTIEFESGKPLFMESLAHSTTPKSLKQLKAEGIPEKIITQLKKLKLVKNRGTVGRCNEETYVDWRALRSHPTFDDEKIFLCLFWLNNHSLPSL